MSKSVALLLVLVFLIATYVIAVQPVKAEGPIVIRPDGSISGTDKIQREGDVFYLTDNIQISSPDYGSAGVLVQRDNIVIDGKYFSIIQTEDTTSVGVDMSGRFNVTIQNVGNQNISGVQVTVQRLNADNISLVSGNYTMANVGEVNSGETHLVKLDYLFGLDQTFFL